jgi:hypothetical protein
VELTEREKHCFCGAQPTVPPIVSGRRVDRYAVHLDHPVVVRGDLKRRGEALTARRRLDIHLNADAFEGSCRLGLLDWQTVTVRWVSEPVGKAALFANGDRHVAGVVGESPRVAIVVTPSRPSSRCRRLGGRRGGGGPVAQAREQGMALTGPGGLLSALTRQVMETAFEAGLTEHLRP